MERKRSEASTQRTGFLSGARNDKKGARTFVFCNNQQKTSAESCSNTYALSTRPQYFAPLLLARAFLQRLHIMPLNIQPLAHPCAILTHRSRPYSLHHREYLDSHRNCSARNQFYVPFFMSSRMGFMREARLEQHCACIGHFLSSRF